MMLGNRNFSGEYFAEIGRLLDTVINSESHAVNEASASVAKCFANDGLLFIFGSGHSHMFAEEAFFRAGGATRICPIFNPPFMLHEGALKSTTLEREAGHAEEILSGYTIDPQKDVLLVVSNSGKNAVPVEVAQTAQQRGIHTLAITSRQYSAQAEDGVVTLADVADIVIDNHCPAGDALMHIAGGVPAIGPASTVVGLTILNAVLVQAMGLVSESGIAPDIFRSAGMDGAIEHNQRLVKQIEQRVPHL